MEAKRVTSDNCDEFIKSNKDKTLTILAFNAQFTGQSHIVADAIQAICDCQDLQGKLALGAVDAEKDDQVAEKFTVLSVPMLVCLHKGHISKRIDNFEPEKVITSIKEELYRLSLIAESDTTTDDKTVFNDYLKKLVARAPVMIFMKGDPKAPRCGFSRQLVELLSKYDIKYDTFDILQDEDVRQGLKEYSDWPTYPQIYAKGEFIGGLDILKQLDESGELESTLKG